MGNSPEAVKNGKQSESSAKSGLRSAKFQARWGSLIQAVERLLYFFQKTSLPICLWSQKDPNRGREANRKCGKESVGDC